MDYANLNLSSVDARVLEPVLIAAFNAALAKAPKSEEVRVLRAMLSRLRKLDLI